MSTKRKTKMGTGMEEIYEEEEDQVPMEPEMDEGPEEVDAGGLLEADEEPGQDDIDKKLEAEEAAA